MTLPQEEIRQDPRKTMSSTKAMWSTPITLIKGVGTTRDITSLAWVMTEVDRVYLQTLNVKPFQRWNVCSNKVNRVSVINRYSTNRYYTMQPWITRCNHGSPNFFAIFPEKSCSKYFINRLSMTFSANFYLAQRVQNVWSISCVEQTVRIPRRQF